MSKKKEPLYTEDDQQKWFAKEDFQDLAKLGSEFLKKTVSSGIDAIKDAKENIPKEASQLLSKGKDELLKGITQETAKTLLSYTVDKFFELACQHRIEFSVRLRKNDEFQGKVKK